MPKSVLVLGAGYAGSAALSRLQQLDVDGLSLTLVADRPYHLVRHEVHRVVRQPQVREHLTVPVEDFLAPETTFVEGRVTEIDTGDRLVALADGDDLEYDYLIVALGSETAFYGIEGLTTHAHTLTSLEDAVGINEALESAAADATEDDPATVVVGGGGLSGIQTVGEIAAYRDETGAPIDVLLVEALDSVLPMGDPDLQTRLADALAAAGVDVLTGDPIVEATESAVRFDGREPRTYDVLVWTGGIEGRSVVGATGLPSERDRLVVDTDFQTTDDRVFAVGDTALVESDDVVPPTAQAAMGAGETAAANVVRAAVDRPLEDWSFRDLGTLVSVGDTAFADDLLGYPTPVIDGTPANVLKKGVAARWIANLSSWPRAIRAWSVL
ncbi:MAG: NAD(P)/FAD-dependent oxidoreductase [Halanaeroarchaeum sp.]